MEQARKGDLVNRQSIVRGKTGQIAVSASLALAVIVALPIPAAAHHDEVVDKLTRGNNDRVSISSRGEQGDGDSGTEGGQCVEGYSASDNGRFVAFSSGAGNLHPADTNGKAIVDVFAFDRKKRKLDLVSVLPTGLTPDLPELPESFVRLSLCGSNYPDISGNGRYVAFVSSLPLTGTDDPETAIPLRRIFVRDLKKGTTELVSRASNGEPADRNSLFPTISDSGRFVAFHSMSSNLMKDEDSACPDRLNVLGVTVLPGPCWQQLYVHDRETGETILVSRSSSGEAANFDVLRGSISGNGRTAVFNTPADNLVPNDRNFNCIPIPSCNDVFVHDLDSGETELISISRDLATSARGESIASFWTQPQVISDDGRFVAFGSNANDLVPANSAVGRGETYIRDRKKGRTERISVSSTGTMLGSNNFSISDDARFAMLDTGTCDDLGPCGPGSTHPHHKAGSFVHDRETGQLDWIAFTYKNGSTEGGPPGNRFLHWVREIGGNGRFFLADCIDACELVPNDNNEADDVFVRDIYRRPLSTSLLSTRTGSPSPTVNFPGTSQSPSTRVAYFADAPDDAVAPNLGAEILETRVAHRPELGDLYVRIDVDRMFGDAPLTGLTPYPVIYGARMTTDSGTYEVRIQGHGGDRLSGGGVFGLFDCTGTDQCTEVTKLKGGFGTVGEAVVISIPLHHLGLSDGGKIKDIEAFAALGTYHLGVSQALDSVVP